MNHLKNVILTIVVTIIIDVIVIAIMIVISHSSSLIIHHHHHRNHIYQEFHATQIFINANFQFLTYHLKATTVSMQLRAACNVPTCFTIFTRRSVPMSFHMTERTHVPRWLYYSLCETVIWEKLVANLVCK